MRQSIGRLTLLGGIAISLSACETLQIPATISSYCQISAPLYPIRPIRKDTAETKRQIAQANVTYERICNGTPEEKGKD